MKHLSKIIILIVLILSSANTWAVNDTITHNFHSLSAGHMTFSKNAAGTKNGVATIDDGTVYTCAGSAAFGTDVDSDTKITINLDNNTDEVVTSQVNNLTKLRVWFYPTDKVRTHLKIQLSTDGSTWGEALSEEVAEYGIGFIEATVDKGSYYIKIFNSKNVASSIFEMQYITEVETCNCFPYVAP